MTTPETISGVIVHIELPPGAVEDYYAALQRATPREP